MGLNRREFIGQMSLGVGALSTCSATAKGLGNILTREQAKADRPNIILIMADDVSSKEFGCYGNKNHNTPTLDALAHSGAMFNTCWATPHVQPITGRDHDWSIWF